MIGTMAEERTPLISGEANNTYTGNYQTPIATDGGSKYLILCTVNNYICQLVIFNYYQNS